MATPTFTKSGNAYSVFTFENSRSLPVNEPIRPNQIIGKAGGGQKYVADLGDAEQEFKLVISRVSQTNRDNLLGFLQDSTVNYAQHTFTYTDEDANAETVRFISIDGVDYPRVRGGLYNIVLTLAKEIT